MSHDWQIGSISSTLGRSLRNQYLIVGVFLPHSTSSSHKALGSAVTGKDS